ncbi:MULTISPECIES: hypothetical protein [Actinosynnema]|uniref:Rv1733c family protein n=1 Tax=Actinosynnema TaxID=40566 RepID=UPI0020A2FCD4|nr:hypothetical protein [Actinosynnema pretiosum]MCP2092615.1 hypothetical protein [Actinosynnema pretiosum]
MRLLPGPNPLARAGDRLVGALFGLVWVVAAIGMPVAGAVGTRTHDRLSDLSDQQTATTVPARAVLLADSPTSDSSTIGAGHERTPVPATWRAPDGTPRRGEVEAGNDLAAGAAVPVWLNQSGEPVPEPLTSGDALLGAAGAGLGTWLALVATATGCGATAHVVVRRAHLRAWEREWARVEPSWRGG